MWIYLSLYYALNTAIFISLTKQLSKHLHPVLLLTLQLLFSLPFILLAVFMVQGGIPRVTPLFYLLVLCSAALDLLAFMCSTWAVKHSPISILAPLSAFTPVFATLTGLIFLGETPTPLKLAGILMIVIGAYCLHVSLVRDGLLAPLRKLLSDRGVRFYFLTTAIFGITPLFQKQAIFQTSPVTPLFVAFWGHLIVAVFMILITFRTIKAPFVPSGRNIGLLAIFGILNALSQLASYYVFATTYIGYATAVFSLSALFSIMMGGIFFKETDLKQRIFGSVIMIAGVILIAL